MHFDDASRTTSETDSARNEFLLSCLSSFERFCGLLAIQPKEGGGRIPFRFSPLQRQYNSARSPRDIILKGRQVYVTTLECARDLWWFLTKPGARVVVVVQSTTDQAPFKDVAYKFRLFIDSLQRAGLKLDFGTESLGEWSLPKRDATLRIIQAGASEVAASKKGRAGTVNRLHVSEVAYFEHAETTMAALLESVAGPEHGTEVVFESTPNGAGGYYFDQWQAAVAGSNGYKPHFLQWWRHPEYRMPLAGGERLEPSNAAERMLLSSGATTENLKWWRRKVGEKGLTISQQEYPTDPESCFLVSGRSFFDGRIVAESVERAIEPIAFQNIRNSGVQQILSLRKEGHGEVPALRVWYEPDPTRQYVVSADPSEGTGGDRGAAGVFERGTGRHMATLWGQIRPWEMARLLVAIARKYRDAIIAVERNNHGGTVLRAIEAEQRYTNVFLDRDGKLGFLTSDASRAPALDAFEQAHRQRVFVTNDRILLSEMRTMIVTERGRAEAAKGSHDDLVMMAAIGWHVVCQSLARAPNLHGIVA